MSEQLVRDLAAQLGVTVESVYGVLLRYQAAYAMAQLGILVLVLVGALMGARIGYLLGCAASESGEDRSLGAAMALVGVVVGGVVCWLFGLLVADVTLHLTNPDYYAIREVLRAAGAAR